MHGGKVTIYSKNGSDFTNRFSRIAMAAPELPVKSCIIDGEIVACRPDGAPDFRALHGGNYAQTDYAYGLSTFLRWTAATSGTCR